MGKFRSCRARRASRRRAPRLGNGIASSVDPTAVGQQRNAPNGRRLDADVYLYAQKSRSGAADGPKLLGLCGFRMPNNHPIFLSILPKSRPKRYYIFLLLRHNPRTSPFVLIDA